MGAYDSYFSGEIRISPPLAWAEIIGGPALRDLKLRLDEQAADTDTGRIMTITAIAVTAYTEMPFNGGAIDKELQSLVDAHPSREWIGHIEARPEDRSGTPWRHLVRNGKAVRVEPRIVWPEDGEAP